MFGPQTVIRLRILLEKHSLQGVEKAFSSISFITIQDQATSLKTNTDNVATKSSVIGSKVGHV